MGEGESYVGRNGVDGSSSHQGGFLWQQMGTDTEITAKYAENMGGLHQILPMRA